MKNQNEQPKQNSTAPAESIQQTQADREAAAQKELNLRLADELADELDNDFFPRDIWNFVVNTLEVMARRNCLGFNDYEYVKAVVPILLNRCPDNYEAINCLIEAFRKERAERARNAARSGEMERDEARKAAA